MHLHMDPERPLLPVDLLSEEGADKPEREGGEGEHAR